MRATITAELIKGLPEGSDMDVFDDRLRGFILRVRPSGVHTYRVRHKWRSMTLGTTDKLKPAQARQMAQAALGEFAQNKDPIKAKKREKAATLRAYISNVYEPWALTHQKRGHETIERLRACFDKDLGGKKLPELTAWAFEKWRSERLKAGRSPSSLNRDFNALRSALNHAVRVGVIDANPLAKVRALKVDRRGVVRFLSEDEELLLREALDAREERARARRESGNEWAAERGLPTRPDLRAVPYVDHLQPLVLLALNSGARRGELLALEWGDVDLDRGVMTVRGSTAKSGQTRAIPLNHEARSVLKDWKACGTGTGLIFPGIEGARMERIGASWKRLLKAAKITSFRFHDLRHSFASKLVMRGVSLSAVQSLLGHADISMTMRYSHLSADHLEEAVGKLTAPEARPAMATDSAA